MPYERAAGGYMAARKASKKVINFFVVGLTYGWKKPSGNGLRYQIGIKQKGKKYKYYRTSGKSKTIKKLKSRKYYYVRVRAYRTSHGKNYYGKWSSAKKTKIK